MKSPRLTSRTVVTLLLIALVASACAADTPALSAGGATTTTITGGPLGPPVNLSGQWVLESGMLDGDPFPLVAGWRVTMDFADGSLGGTAACNGYGGDYTLDGTTLTIGQLAATEMGCAPEVMESEQAFMTAIQRPLGFERQGETLSLTGEGVELRFTAVTALPTAELIGVVWLLQTLIDGGVAIQARGEPTLELMADGTVFASTGCRELSGTYIISGDELQFPSLAAAGQCPPELADQDSVVISVLEGSRVEIEGDQLTLLSSGTEGLQYSLSR